MASIDSVSDITPRIQYTAATSQVAFDAPFPFFVDADLTVDVDGVAQTLTTDYTVSGAGADTGGTVTFVTAPGNGAVVTIYRETAIARSTDFQQNGPFSSTSHNDELDKITIVLQELKAQIGRAIRFPFTSSISNTQTLMSPISNFKGKFLRVTSAGILEGAELLDSVTTLSQSVIGALLNPQTTREAAQGIDPPNKWYKAGNVLRYGTNTTPGTTDMATPFQNAIDCNDDVFAPEGTYLIATELSVPDTCRISGVGFGTIIKKGANGFTMNLGEQASVKDIYFQGNKANYTGGGIEVDTGDDGASATIADDGFQDIRRCWFAEFNSYCVDYPTAGKGRLSTIEDCYFLNYDSAAAIRWPDEPASGGNRRVIKCFSDEVLLNANGCDNGAVADNDIGGSNTTGQGVLFPAGTTNRAQKIRITGNRFAIANGTINIRGVDIIFTENITNGSVTLEDDSANDGATSVYYRDNETTGTFTDSSGTTNFVYLEREAFTPTWTAASANPSVGNADIRCEYQRLGRYVEAYYFIKMGSTTTFGTGAWSFTLPVSRVPALTTTFVGSASGKNNSLVAQTDFQNDNDTVVLFTTAGTAVDSTNPVTWASADVLSIYIKYRFV